MQQNPEGILVPCGKCINCRIKKRKEWSLRVWHECSTHEKNMFITLTYQDKYLPENGSLKKRDLQLFFKRLRKILDSQGRKIRYYACGEYGDQTERPHYHAIIFGMGLEDKKIIMQAWPYSDWTVPAILRNAFGLAEVDSIDYVARYIDKKLSGEEAKNAYTARSREPIFRLSSLGIGRDYVDKNIDQLRNQQAVTKQGINLGLPRYYLNRVGLKTQKEKALDKQRDDSMCAIGQSMTEQECYRLLPASLVVERASKVKKSNTQKALNAIGRTKQKKRSL